MRRFFCAFENLARTFVGLVAFGFVSTANAALFNTFADRTDFTLAVGGPLSTETFNSFAAEIPFHSAPLDVGAFTLSMTGSPSTILGRNRIDIPPVGFPEFDVDGTAVAFALTNTDESLFLTFDSAISAFGVDLAGFNDVLLRTNMFVGTEDLTPAVTASNEVRFFGITSDTLFTTVEFRGVINDGYGLDNVAFGLVSVPEPSAPALFSIALVGMFLTRRRSKTA